MKVALKTNRFKIVVSLTSVNMYQAGCLPSTAADDLFSKVKKYLLSILFGFIFIFTSSGQAPSWIAGTPSIPSTGIFSITCNYGINMPGTVYIVVYENAQTNLFSRSLKST